MEEFEEFMAEMLKEYNYDKDTVMVTTAFAQALANEWGEQLLIQRVSQRSELLPLFDDRHLNNGIAFTLTESGKLGKHPESKLVYETTIKLKKWILDNFELKKR
tara:strand:+ start:51 stop:362 length:312 start_codon:yes stop_codon:yes gene_type:complete